MTITTEVKAAVTAFLTAFDALDWEPFAACFAPDATIFMPFPDVIQRLDGWEAAAAVFQPFFAKIRQTRNAPPYLDLQPRDLHIQPINNSAAIVTFHLYDGVTWSRRTAVFEKRNGRWLIVHLHASNVRVHASNVREA